jgi:hypothetical protein
MHVGAGMVKYPSLMAIFPLPPPYPTTTITPINMISSFSNGSLDFFNPWVVPHSKDVESYGSSITLIAIDIVSLEIPSSLVETSQQLPPHMECDLPTSLERVVDSLH